MPQELPSVLVRETLVLIQHRFTGIIAVSPLFLVLVSCPAPAAAETSTTSHASGKRGVVVAGGQAAVDARLAIL